jgi:hypothetical protein
MNLRSKNGFDSNKSASPSRRPLISKLECNNNLNAVTKLTHLEHLARGISSSPQSSSPIINKFSINLDVPLEVQNQQFMFDLKVLFHNMLLKQMYFAKSNRPIPPLFLTVRSKIIIFVEEIAFRHYIKLNTLCLAIKYIDEIFTIANFQKEEMQLIVLCCFSLAVKLEEHADRVPSISLINGYLSEKFCYSQIVKAEQIIFKILTYSLRRQNPIDFVEIYMCLHPESNLTPNLHNLSVEVASISRYDYNLNFFEPSVIAAASLLWSRTVLKADPWPNSIVEALGITMSQLTPCLTIIKELFTKYLAFQFADHQNFNVGDLSNVMNRSFVESSLLAKRQESNKENISKEDIPKIFQQKEFKIILFPCDNYEKRNPQPRIRRDSKYT